MSIAKSATWKALKDHAKDMQKEHLREMMLDEKRCSSMLAEFDNIVLDYSRQLANAETVKLLFDLGHEAKIFEKVQAMYSGEKINTSENRAVLHVALRAPTDAEICVDDKDVIPDVHRVLADMRHFSNQVRAEKITGITGKPLKQIIAIGIGGSYLGPEFVYEALRTDKTAAKAAEGRTLKFLANVDPIDVTRALEDCDPEETLVIVISKTFTTAETMLNAKTVRAWLKKNLGESAVAKHMIAVSTNLKAVESFGIDPKNTFGFWDWVGGRYSVWSAVGILPLSLHFGFSVMKKFLAGANTMDQHFLQAPMTKNLPVLLGLLGVWNSSFLGHSTRALLPYCQALCKFAPHIQQVDMESNGKRVDVNGKPLSFEAGEINFGEPGTNGQHSFYQLMHQGRVVPADFIGFKHSQQHRKVAGHPVSNHDELMANFFAQPDALAFGKTAEECRADGVPEELITAKEFPGNRPSNVIMMEELNAFTLGQLLALYEHRTAVQGFIWEINSFDQWGVELGKVLAKKVVSQMADTRKSDAKVNGFNYSTTRLLERYLN